MTRKLMMGLWVLLAAAPWAMAETATCGGPAKSAKLEMLFTAAVNGGQAEKNALLAELWPTVKCLSDAGQMPRTRLKGTYAVLQEAQSALTGTSIALVTDAQIMAVGRKLPAAKCGKKKKVCGDACDK